MKIHFKPDEHCFDTFFKMEDFSDECFHQWNDFDDNCMNDWKDVCKESYDQLNEVYCRNFACDLP